MLIKKITLFVTLISFFPMAQAVQSDSVIEHAILIHINEYRKQHSLPQLKMDNRIVKEAKKHSMDMAKHTLPFGHQHFINRVDRLHAQMKSSGGAAENVAYNYKNAKDVVKNWLLSPGHKRNIDGRCYHLTGIGVSRDENGRIYFTQIFMT